MDQLIWEAAAQSLCNSPDTHIVYDLQLFYQSCIGKSGKVIGHQAVYMLLQGTDRLHQGALKVGADTHDLTSCLHLGS